MKYRELLQWGKDSLEAASVPEPEVDAWLLLSHSSGLSRARYYMVSEDAVEESLQKDYEALIARRKTREPLQYITGTAEFMGLEFQVNPSVLIPRQDTENLVEEVLGHLEPSDDVLDMCTGSGCIIISLLKNCPGCKGVGADTSQEALETAKRNGKHNEVDVTWVHTDLFSQIKGQFDVIVSNPPYIPTAVVDQLMPEVRDFEPGLALDGNEDGLLFYRRIAQEAKPYLKGKKYVFFEIGFDQGEDVSRIMREAGFLDVRVIQDYAHSDRIVCGHL